MPDPEAFLRGFGVTEGLQLAGFYLASVSATHITIKRNRQYKYTTTMVFTGQGDPNQLSQALAAYTQGTRIINSRYGNPYQCWFGSPVIAAVLNGQVNIVAEGGSVRA